MTVITMRGRLTDKSRLADAQAEELTAALADERRRFTDEKGQLGQINYAAAKGAPNSAPKALSLEVASRGVTVNAIAPGIIASPMAHAVFDPAVINQMVPVKRTGTPQEVAALASFLASEEAGYITGQVISINGGMI